MSPSTTKTTIKFLLDENVPIKIRSFLETKGYSVVLTPKGIKNGQVIALANKEKRTLITHDTDFVEATLSTPAVIYGVIVFRIHPPHEEKLCASLEKMLRDVTEFCNKRFLLDETGYTIFE